MRTAETDLPQPIDTGPKPATPAVARAWKPVFCLLLLSPTVGELLSGSSPPLQFFNPLALLLLVGLYGCGALLVREIAAWRSLTSTGTLFLGAAYGIIEEGLMCKSFFNPYWTDTGFLSIYGRAWGVNWVWAFGLTFYHMVVSITVPIFLTEALFPSIAGVPWLRRRGTLITATSFFLVTLLGFCVFDNRQFHLIEIKESLAMAQRINVPTNELERFIARQLKPKNKEVIQEAVAAHQDSSDLRHALQDELNRLLPRADLYSATNFSNISLPENLKSQAAKPPKGDKLVEFNRALLESVFPQNLIPRPFYPYRPGWVLTLVSLLVIGVLVRLALQQNATPQSLPFLRKPWLTGIGCTVAFVLVGFIIPSLVEHGAKIPAALDCALWCAAAVFIARLLRRTNGQEDDLWRRGLWAIGVLTPWIFFALLLGIFVGMIGAKSFSGMVVVALAFGLAILRLAVSWRRRLVKSTPHPDPLPSEGEREHLRTLG